MTVVLNSVVVVVEPSDSVDCIVFGDDVGTVVLVDVITVDSDVCCDRVVETVDCI